MENKRFERFYFCSLIAVSLASFYPIYMGISVVADMIKHGTVYAEDYPKYIIPYTPIALAVIVGVALIPLMMKWVKKYSVLAGSGISVAVFFTSELLLERLVTVTRTHTELVSNLESWQMYMCYIPPETFTERTWTEVDVLMGEYSPAFKLHFYIISVVLVISLLNCFYGFGKMLKTGEYSRARALTVQAVSSVAFLGMCIWACFTAFYRDGAITVSPLSATLMCVFFILFGVTVGAYTASFTLNKRRLWSVALPAVLASAITLVMYVGEMILLSGHLYRFGSGWFFDGLGALILAPVDILVILASGGIAAITAHLLQKREPKKRIAE
jgi:hypothetical protein